MQVLKVYLHCVHYSFRLKAKSAIFLTDEENSVDTCTYKTKILLIVFHEETQIDPRCFSIIDFLLHLTQLKHLKHKKIYIWVV